MTLSQRLRAAIDVLTKKQISANNGLQYNITPSGQIIWQGQNSQSLVNDGYCSNDLVFAIVQMIQQKAKLAPFALYKIKDKMKYKELKSFTASIGNASTFDHFKHISELKSLALEPVTTYDKLNELFKFANDEDTFQDLIEQWVGFKIATGNSFVYTPIIEAGANKGKPQAFYITPAQYMSIVADTNVYPTRALSYQLYYGLMYSFNKDEIIHDKYFNPKYSASGSELYGMSPLLPAARNITRSNQSKDASVSMYKNGGPAGVLFMDDQRFDAPQLAAQASILKNNLQQYEGAKKVNQIAVSPYKTGFVNTGLSPVDLGLIEAEKWDLRALCNILGVPSQLLNDPEGKTYNNTKEGEKAFTTRAVLPHLNSIRENINRAMYFKWGYSQDYVCDFDLSVYPELQEDQATKWAFVKELPISWKEKLSMMDINANQANPVLNEVWVGAGVQPIDGINIPNTGDYGA